MPTVRKRQVGQGPGATHWVGAKKHEAPGEAMQLQRGLSALNLALFWLNYGFSAKPVVSARTGRAYINGCYLHHDKGPENQAG